MNINISSNRVREAEAVLEFLVLLLKITPTFSVFCFLAADDRLQSYLQLHLSLFAFAH